MTLVLTTHWLPAVHFSQSSSVQCSPFHSSWLFPLADGGYHRDVRDRIGAVQSHEQVTTALCYGSGLVWSPPIAVIVRRRWCVNERRMFVEWRRGKQHAETDNVAARGRPFDTHPTSLSSADAKRDVQKTCPDVRYPHGLTWYRTKASANTGRGLTDWAIARTNRLSHCTDSVWNTETKRAKRFIYEYGLSQPHTVSVSVVVFGKCGS
jgi:hypothetical protein